MYHSDEIEANREAIRNAVINARLFKPLYVKMKVFYGCNLKCEMQSLAGNAPAAGYGRTLQGADF